MTADRHRPPRGSGLPLPAGFGVLLSPLLADALDAEGLKLGEVVAGLRASGDVFFAGSYARTPWNQLATLAYLRAARFRTVVEDWRFGHVHAHLGSVLRLPSHPAGALGVRLVGRSLRLSLAMGRHLLLVTGANGRLLLDMRVPETILDGCVGRDLDALVSHPLFDGRGYRLVRRQVGRMGSKDGAGRSVISFRTPGIVHVVQHRPGDGSTAGSGHSGGRPSSASMSVSVAP